MIKNSLKEIKIQTRLVFSGDFLKIKSDKVKLPNGEKAMREYVHHPGASVIIAILPDGKIVFENQYRYSVKKNCLELPAGKIENKEDPINTAKRELKEETGFTATHWKKIGVILPTIGYSDEKIHIYVATNLKTGTQSLDNGEFLEILEFSSEEILELINLGKIDDAKTIWSFFLFLLKKK